MSFRFLKFLRFWVVWYAIYNLNRGFQFLKLLVSIALTKIFIFLSEKLQGTWKWNKYLQQKGIQEKSVAKANGKQVGQYPLEFWPDRPCRSCCMREKSTRQREGVQEITDVTAQQRFVSLTGLQALECRDWTSVQGLECGFLRAGTGLHGVECKDWSAGSWVQRKHAWLYVWDKHTTIGRTDQVFFTCRPTLGKQSPHNQCLNNLY